jgi:hypothetical protein
MNRALLLIATLLLLVAAPAAAVDPGTYDITVQAGEDYVLNLTLDSAGIPIDLTGKTYKMQGRKTPLDVAPFLSFSTAVGNGTSGQLSAWARHGSTRAAAGNFGVYDLMQIDPDGMISYIIRGALRILPTVTR